MFCASLNGKPIYAFSSVLNLVKECKRRDIHAEDTSATTDVQNHLILEKMFAVVDSIAV